MYLEANKIFILYYFGIESTIKMLREDLLSAFIRMIPWGASKLSPRLRRLRSLTVI